MYFHNMDYKIKLHFSYKYTKLRHTITIMYKIHYTFTRKEPINSILIEKMF
jgi:hypothetical protein